MGALASDRPTKIIAGGQSGADEGALRAAKILGIPTGGWIPRGFRTEKGSAPWLKAWYGLKEMPTEGYRPRTIRNLMEADGTVVWGNCQSAGSAATLTLLRKAEKPLIVNPSPTRLRRFIREHAIGILNVAGNRESGNPGIEAFVCAQLILTWGDGTQTIGPWITPRLIPGREYDTDEKTDEQDEQDEQDHP